MTTYINDTPAPSAQTVASLAGATPAAPIFFFDGTDLYRRTGVDLNAKVSDPNATNWLDNHWGAGLVNRKVNIIIDDIHFSTPAV